MVDDEVVLSTEEKYTLDPDRGAVHKVCVGGSWVGQACSYYNEVVLSTDEKYTLDPECGAVHKECGSALLKLSYTCCVQPAATLHFPHTAC